jgi:hypothetical protein
MDNVKVVKSLHRKYGYSLQWVGPNCPSWIVGPSNTWTWFRYKWAAQAYLDQMPYNRP